MIERFSGGRQSGGIPAVWAALLGCLLAAPAWGQSRASQVEEGLRLAMDGAYQEALEILESVLGSDPEDPLLNYYVGLTQLRLKRPRVAIAYLEKAVQEQVSFPQAFLWLARAYGEEKRLPEARAVLAEGLKRHPRNRDLQDLARELEVATGAGR